MADIPSDVRVQLEGHPWNESIPRLLRHAENKIQRRRWRGSFGGVPPGGIEAHDVVHTVIEKVLSGIRRWDPNSQPDLFGYLRAAVDSEISNLVRSYENRRLQSEGTVPASTFEQIDESTPESALLAKEREAQSDVFITGFLDSLNGEPNLQKLVMAFVDGMTKRSEIAEHLGVSVEEIDSQRKKLRRRLEDYMVKGAIIANP